jgi:hypothetical protein
MKYFFPNSEVAQKKINLGIKRKNLHLCRFLALS